MSTFLPIAKPFFSSPLTNRQSPIVLCDFDGTISNKDVTDTLLSHFGQAGCDELETLWETGKIGSKECMSKQIALLDANLIELNQVLDGIEIDAGFFDFVQYCETNKIPVHIVSDGLDYAIQYILARHKLSYLPIFANQLMHNNNRGWQLTFPYANQNCIKKSGNCKCQHVKQQVSANPVLYVGDGSSDFCVSHNVDLVFAKDKLITYCQQHNISHLPIQNFADVTKHLQTNILF